MILAIWRLEMDVPVSVLAALGAAMSWQVWRGSSLVLRLGDVEVIVRRWRRR
jgi:hypothetical protein